MPSHEELVKMHQDSLALADQAREFLEKQGYAPPAAQRR